MRRALVAVLAFLLIPGWVTAQPQPSGNATRGEEVYRTFCWTCHGPYGRGDGPAAPNLTVHPPDFTNPAVLGGTSDQQVVARLTARKGRPDAKAHPMNVVVTTLKEDALRDAIAYIRTLAVPGKHVSLPAGRDIYNTFCSACHGSQGDGQGPAARNLVGVKPRDFTSKDFIIEGREEQIYQTIFGGAAKAFHGSPYMPEWKTALSLQQIRDVVEYLKTFKKSRR